MSGNVLGDRGDTDAALGRFGCTVERDPALVGLMVTLHRLERGGEARERGTRPAELHPAPAAALVIEATQAAEAQ